jgi:hypothetical protein
MMGLCTLRCCMLMLPMPLWHKLLGGLAQLLVLTLLSSDSPLVLLSAAPAVPSSCMSALLLLLASLLVQRAL